jgi:hypothetical protein
MLRTANSLARRLGVTLFVDLRAIPVGAQGKPAERQARLRGSVVAERAWWDVQRYALSLRVLPGDKRIEGSNKITFRVVGEATRMQVDLQPPSEREGNVYWGDSARPRRSAPSRSTSRSASRSSGSSSTATST